MCDRQDVELSDYFGAVCFVSDALLVFIISIINIIRGARKTITQATNAIIPLKVLPSFAVCPGRLFIILLPSYSILDQRAESEKIYYGVCYFN